MSTQTRIKRNVFGLGTGSGSFAANANWNPGAWRCGGGERRLLTKAPTQAPVLLRAGRKGYPLSFPVQGMCGPVCTFDTTASAHPTRTTPRLRDPLPELG